MKIAFITLVAMVVFLAILEANTSRPTLEESTVFSLRHYSLDKTDTLLLDAKEATSTMNEKGDSTTGVTDDQSDGEEKDSSTNSHHYFPCAKQSDYSNQIHT
ncbi:hypothetical protein L6452_24930 [Arctium lappa]|uniref:Uncharacterized protein n=1 Tax=Arctium lappa TaxID=4217 RepID=A0ACB9AAS4_ARCLA|nr:hypothetical protein L6452_24930 [Arctium lappa]